MHGGHTIFYYKGLLFLGATGDAEVFALGHVLAEETHAVGDVVDADCLGATDGVDIDGNLENFLEFHTQERANRFVAFVAQVLDTGLTGEAENSGFSKQFRHF